MYDYVPARAGKAWPIAAICCLGILGFLIASTIVLALIPVFLPQKTLTPASASSDDTFYLQYFADSDSDDSVSGSVTNLDDVSNALGVGDDELEVFEGFAKASYDRKKRSALNRRQKRSVGMNFNFGCRYKVKKGCNGNCRSNFIKKIDQKIQSRGSLPNLPCRIAFGNIVRTLTITFKYVGIEKTSIRPVGFSFVNSTTFVAIASGALTDPSIWLGGVVPFAGCSAVIASGITVSHPGSTLSIPLKSIDCAGTVQLGQGGSSFTFARPANIIVRSGGSCQDLTDGKKLIFPEKSVITVRTGGSFGTTSTVIQKSSSSGIASSTTLLSTSGPLTCGIAPNVDIIQVPRVTAIVAQSGDFSTSSTFLGDVVPTADSCESSCGLYIPPGCTLDTSSLQGTMSVPFTEIDVPAGANLQLGTSGSSAGFKFLTAVLLNVYGGLSFIGSGGQIQIPFGSSFNFFGGGHFTSINNVIVQTISLTGVLGSLFTLSASFFGPLFYIVSVTGTVTNTNSTSTTISTVTTTIATTTTDSVTPLISG